MRLHRLTAGGITVYAFFDAQFRMVESPTLYLHHIARTHRYSLASQQQIAYVVAQFLTHVEQSPYFAGFSLDDALRSFTCDHLMVWIQAQRGEQVSERTIHSREALLREMFNYLSTDEAGRRVNVSPWIDGKLVTRVQRRTLPRYVTEAQVILLLQGLNSESQRAAAHFMFDTGVRVSELCRINRDALPDLRLWPEQPYYPIAIPGSKGRHGSHIKLRESIISHAMLTRIRKYHHSRAYYGARGWTTEDPSKPLFLSVNGQRLTGSGVRKSLQAAAKRQQLDPSSVSPHRLRHGAGFSVLRSDLGPTLLDNLLILRGMLGHNQIETTERYAHIPIVAVLKDRAVVERYAEAERIYEQTIRYPKDETERRGRQRDTREEAA